MGSIKKYGSNWIEWYAGRMIAALRVERNTLEAQSNKIPKEFFFLGPPPSPLKRIELLSWKKRNQPEPLWAGL